MIDEKKLLEELDVRYDRYVDKYVECLNTTNASTIIHSFLTELYMVQDVVRKQPVIDCGDCVPIMNLKAALYDKDMENRWIPCREELPKTNGVYQVTRKLYEGDFEYRIATSAYFDGSDTWHNDLGVNHGRKYLTDVIAWKQQSEPYRGE